MVYLTLKLEAILLLWACISIVTHIITSWLAGHRSVHGSEWAVRNNCLLFLFIVNKHHFMVRPGVYHTGVTQQSEPGKVDVGKEVWQYLPSD